MDRLELEIKELIIRALRLEDLAPADIAGDAPLFGEGLGLDSVDALELGVALQKQYGVRLPPDPQESRRHFATVRSLAAYVASQSLPQAVDHKP